MNLQDWLADTTVLLTEEWRGIRSIRSICSSGVECGHYYHLVTATIIMVGNYRVCITFWRARQPARPQSCQGYNNIFVFHGGFCSVIIKVEPCNLLFNLHPTSTVHGKMCLINIHRQEHGGERLSLRSAFTTPHSKRGIIVDSGNWQLSLGF